MVSHQNCDRILVWRIQGKNMIRRTFLKALCVSPLGFLIPKKKKDVHSSRLRPSGWFDGSGGGTKAAWRDTETGDVYVITENYGGEVIWELHKSTDRQYVKKRVEMRRSRYIHI